MVSSVFTLGAAYLYVKVKRAQWQREIDQAINAKMQEVEASLGTLIEQKVSQGVVNGVRAIPTTEMLKDTTRTVARTGAELVEDGLQVLLSGGRSRKSK